MYDSACECKTSHCLIAKGHNIGLFYGSENHIIKLVYSKEIRCWKKDLLSRSHWSEWPMSLWLIVSIFAYAFNMSLPQSQHINILRVLLFHNFRSNSSFVVKFFEKEWLETPERWKTMVRLEVLAKMISSLLKSRTFCMKIDVNYSVWRAF